MSVGLLSFYFFLLKEGRFLAKVENKEGYYCNLEMCSKEHTTNNVSQLLNFLRLESSESFQD